MSKVRINDEVFDFDFQRKPMSEALALEAAAGMRYAEWESELAAGSMKALCGLIWLVWRRDGRQVELKDLLSGEIDVDITPLLESLIEIGEEAADPTSADPAAPGPDGTPGMRTATRSSSRKSSTSGPGKSGS